MREPVDGKSMITIIDYGMGNLGSIANMLKKIGAEAVISSDLSVIGRADKLILPGVGAFDSGMKKLHERGLPEILSEKVIAEKTPILGICLGMQLMTKRSEEGSLPGLGWIDAETIRFRFGVEGNEDLRVPHMGWNTVHPAGEGELFRGMTDELRFYFVHSFHLVCNDENDIAARTHYGYNFVSAVRRGNIMGVQFHPEKSHKFGMRLLKNFVEI
jgi:glutamine amidotransferase